MALETKPILVTGANGFLGSAVVRTLLAEGRRVRAATRRDAEKAPASVESVTIGDLSSQTDWSHALKDVDSVVHCAARAHVLNETAKDPLTLFRRMNTEATIALARQAAAASVRRLVFISSIGVNGSETKGTPFKASDTPSPHSPYAVSKYEAEAALAKVDNLEVVIIRPPLILGSSPKGNLATLNRAIESGLPLPFGLVRRNRRDFVSLDVLCGLVSMCLDHPAAPGQVFLAADGKPLSTRALLERLAAEMDRPARLWPAPPALLDLLLRVLGKPAIRSQLLGDLEIDIAHTRETLDWTPTVQDSDRLGISHPAAV